MSQPSRVFVVQQPAVYDRVRRAFVPKYDLSAAEDHGAIVTLLGPGNIFRDRLANAVARLSAMLKDYRESDFILAVGDPVAIAAAVLIAGRATGGIVHLLKWDRLSSSYEPFEIRA